MVDVMVQCGISLQEIHDQHIQQYHARTGSQNRPDQFDLVSVIEGIIQTLDPDNDHTLPSTSNRQESVRVQCYRAVA